MNADKYWKALSIAGYALAVNGAVFFIINYSMQSDVLFGPAIGCLVSGIPLVIVGLILKRKISETAS